jgi:prepilin peptidase CpaA
MDVIPKSPALITTVVVVALAAIVDVSRRRIPNVITFPGMALGLAFWLRFDGWAGGLLAVGGAVVSPLVLILVHAGHRPGMGDVKLAAAVGSLLGPAVGGIAVLVSAVVGGALAIVSAMRPGTTTARMMGTFLIGVPILERFYSGSEVVSDEPLGTIPIPYGVAIGLGSILTVGGLCWR